MQLGLFLGRPCRVLLSFDTEIKQLAKWMGWEPGVSLLEGRLHLRKVRREDDPRGDG